MTINIQFYPLGEQAIVAKFDSELNENTYEQVCNFSRSLEQNPIIGTIETVPTFTTVTIYYDPFELVRAYQSKDNNINKSTQSSYNIILALIQDRIAKMKKNITIEHRTIKIPVCYEGDFAPDLEYVAMYNQLSTEEVIQNHSEGEYLVYMLGFAPGFPYMGGMSSKIATPRRSEPRVLVSAGSVGIAGEQTGIYSLDSPGGWQIIGRTPLTLFQPENESPTLLRAGDRIQFYSISIDEYTVLEEKQK
ncbi:5-oxoprolinase subunit PxpB [Chengkuizengella sediminis]|uniref:5-oxoprolinase subunit PxpB n=1 Tax=Chengkuizengella sediminis TaxID=1885917 RepID=UPI00138A5BDC|nr:5-oxoprolinase subunit PxpB [Chengkuizengella sediminis]NDI35684.1 5-oxoprolinase subunit PxpB [Chengkuizengella sediminis]